MLNPWLIVQVVEGVERQDLYIKEEKERKAFLEANFQLGLASHDYQRELARTIGEISKGLSKVSWKILLKDCGIC